VRTRVKFCGCTNADDAELAVVCGVDAIGVILAAESPRRVSTQQAHDIARTVPAFVSLVAVFVEPNSTEVAAARAAGYTPQFSGNESAPWCEASAAGPYIKVQHVEPGASAGSATTRFAAAARDYQHATWMFDTQVDGKHGGTGRAFDWGLAREIAGDRRIIISGGLTPENVGACIRRVRPYGVDVRSGIETNGVKDRGKMHAFLRAVKEADAEA
jgi:phosphoribosylanthranilate isomerase